MEQHRVMFMDQHEDEGYGSQLPSNFPKQEESSDDDEEEEEEEKIINTVILPGIKKRKRLSLSQLKEVKVETCKKQTSHNHKTKKHERRSRWSAGRYELAEQSMWEVLKAEGATFEHPITRPALRMAARTRISDTGLLDHLLKHIDGKVSPGGTERFRRCFNPNGIMEYWLESADMDKVCQEAGAQDPSRIPLSSFRAGIASSRSTDSSNELELLKIEMAQMKKDMQELIAKQQQKSKISMVEDHKEFVKWKTSMDHSLTGIIASVKDVQGKHGEFTNWKSKVEHQLADLTNTLTDLKAQRECSNFSPPSEKWKDWIKSTNLENVQEDELATWIGSSELLNVPKEVVIENPNNSDLPTQLLREDLTNKKSSDLVELVPMRQEDQPNVTPDSSTTVNSKSDLDNSLIMFQEMFMDIFKWREKIEQQLFEVSNTVCGMLAMK